MHRTEKPKKIFIFNAVATVNYINNWMGIWVNKMMYFECDLVVVNESKFVALIFYTDDCYAKCFVNVQQNI